MMIVVVRSDQEEEEEEEEEDDDDDEDFDPCQDTSHRAADAPTGLVFRASTRLSVRQFESFESTSNSDLHLRPPSLLLTFIVTFIVDQHFRY
jgi:hypothetical protein